MHALGQKKRHGGIARSYHAPSFLYRAALFVVIVAPAAACQAEPPKNTAKRSDAKPPRQLKAEVLSSPLQRAIARGMRPDGDLANELSELGDYTIRSREDAQAICEALGKLRVQPRKGSAISSPLFSLTSLFQDVESGKVPAFEVMYKEGLPQLIRIFDAKLRQMGNAKDDSGEVDDLLFILKVLAMYGSREGAEKIVAAARQPLKPDDYLWHVILANFAEGNPHSDYLFKALADPLPPDFLAVALLDSANHAATDGELKNHPFDSEAGWQRLENWFTDRDPDHFSYARSATAALPFVSNPARDRLLALAMNHVDAAVKMEAAFAGGKFGSDAALKALARFCLDVNHSEAARDFLTELDREDLIPAEANDPSFKAKAEFAGWLAHANELGQPPDEVEIVDHRRLAWPPERDPEPFWLIRYWLRDRTGLADDDVDCGLVGSMTWCFGSYRMHERPPEDCYAIHCYFEMEIAGLIKEVEVTDAAAHAGMLGQWKGAPLHEPTITRVAELSAELKYPAGLVAQASATIGGEEGWVVLDGPRSAWYPKAEQPEETHDGVILMIHVGGNLLGFQGRPDRKKYLAGPRPPRPPRQTVAAYEKLMAEAACADPKRQEVLLGSFSLLASHFDAYVDALHAIRGGEKPDILIDVYGRFLRLAEQADGSVRDEVYDILGVLGKGFDAYVDALVTRGRSGEIAGLIDLIAPHWDHNSGYLQLGRAAFKAGRRDAAVRFFLKVHDEMESYYRAEEMSLLAEIWHGRGEAERARELLVDCMRKLVAEIKESKYLGDRQLYAKEFQHHRSSYLRLFPDTEAQLVKMGLPADPLR